MTVSGSFQTPSSQFPGSRDGSERLVVFLLLPQLNLLDLAGPAQVFQAARRLGAPYNLLFCASQPEFPTALGLTFAHLQPLAAVQTVNFGKKLLISCPLCW